MFTQINLGKPTSSDDASTKEMTCKEAWENIYKIKVGMKSSEVITLIGRPKSIENEVWVYDFFNCVPPPKAGTQTVIGMAITFDDTIVTKIDYATICATGPGI